MSGIEDSLAALSERHIQNASQLTYSSGAVCLKIPTQLIRFALVGVLNTFLHLAIVGLLTQLIGLSQLISNVTMY